MAKKKIESNQKFQAWVDARKRHDLSHAQVQMARELGLPPPIQSQARTQFTPARPQEILSTKAQNQAAVCFSCGG